MSAELPSVAATPQASPDSQASPELEHREQCLPDGFGLSVEVVQKMLLDKHKLDVPLDDPLLMMVTIQNAFLEAQSRLQKKHEKALGAFMGEQTAAYVQEVEKSVSELQKTLSSVTINGIQGAVSDFAKAMSDFRTTLFACTGIMALSALINVAVFVLKAVRHG